MFKKEIIVYLATLLLVQQTTCSLLSGAGNKNIIDKDPLTGESLTKLCSDPTQRISKVSSVAWFLEQFESLNDVALAACRDLYLNPLRALNKVTGSQADNVCSLAKVKLIDEFQWNYQMGAMSKKWFKFAKGFLPEPLKVFFLHYVSDITTLCKVSLPDSLQLAALQKDTSQDEATVFDGSFGKVVGTFQEILIPFKKIKHYDNFVLLWDMMISHERKKNNDLGFEDPASGEKLLALVKTKNATAIWKAQSRCRQILRPVYRDTVLPVMKLIDLGYDIKDRHLNHEMKENDEQRDWFMLTQTCELLMPMKFYEDKTMKFWEVGEMETFEEAKDFLEEPMGEDKLIELSRVKVQPISLPDELKSALNVDEIKLEKTVKSNVKSRNALYRKTVKNVVINTCSHYKSGYKKILSQVKKLVPNVGKKEPVFEEEIRADVLKETDKFIHEDEKLDTEVELSDSGKVALSREKRLIGKLVFLVFAIMIIASIVIICVHAGASSASPAPTSTGGTTSSAGFHGAAVAAHAAAHGGRG